MKYNFDEIIERRGTNSYKWDLVKGRRRYSYVGSRHGFPDSSLHHRSPAEASSSRHLRLHPRTGFLLRGYHQLVLPPPPVEDRERLDSLYIRRSTCHFLLPEGHLHARRERFWCRLLCTTASSPASQTAAAK